MVASPAWRFFDAIAARYDRVYAPARDESAARMNRVLAEISTAGRVLDLGVGTGRELPWLLDAGHEVVGLDASPEMLAVCARRARPIALHLGDLWATLPFDDRSFDAVIALHGTLAHAPSTAALDAFPKEVARVLRQGGVFVAEVPAPSWLEMAAKEPGGSIAWLGDGRGRFVDSVSGEVVDVWLPTKDEWQERLSRELDVCVEPAPRGELWICGRRR